jgi:hypothetical protein
VVTRLPEPDEEPCEPLVWVTTGAAEPEDEPDEAGWEPLVWVTTGAVEPDEVGLDATGCEPLV